MNKRKLVALFIVCVLVGIFLIGCSPSQTYLDMCREEIKQDYNQYTLILEEAIKNKKLSESNYDKLIKIGRKYHNPEFPLKSPILRQDMDLSEYEKKIAFHFLLFSTLEIKPEDISLSGLRMNLDLANEYAMEKVK